jgi:hypothetical protein
MVVQHGFVLDPSLTIRVPRSTFQRDDVHNLEVRSRGVAPPRRAVTPREQPCRIEPREDDRGPRRERSPAQARAMRLALEFKSVGNTAGNIDRKNIFLSVAKRPRRARGGTGPEPLPLPDTDPAGRQMVSAASFADCARQHTIGDFTDVAVREWAGFDLRQDELSTYIGGQGIPHASHTPERTLATVYAFGCECVCFGAARHPIAAVTSRHLQFAHGKPGLSWRIESSILGRRRSSPLAAGRWLKDSQVCVGEAHLLNDQAKTIRECVSSEKRPNLRLKEAVRGPWYALAVL